MTKRLEGKVALVTGSTAGCGRATAIRFAAEGARVMVTGRNRDAGGEITKRIRAEGGTAAFHAADIGVEAEVHDLVARTVSTYGRLDILVNNASPTELQRGPNRVDNAVTELATSELNALWQPALYGYFWSCRYGIAAMMKSSAGGSVINISSATSLQGVAGADAYTAVKGAINATTRSMAVEYGPFGIRVNAIVLGLIITSEMAQRWTEDAVTSAPLKAAHLTRWGRPEDIANAALFLASDESAFITGSLLIADGGVSAMSGFPSGAMKQRTVGAANDSGTSAK